MILQWGLSQPSARTPTETTASTFPSAWSASICIRSLIGVVAVIKDTLIPSSSIASTVVSATVTSGQNHAEIGFGFTFSRSSR